MRIICFELWAPMADCRNVAWKVSWFRRRAVRARWYEERLLVNEEMHRVLRFFLYFEAWWIRIGRMREGSGDRGGAAYAKK